LPIFKTELMQHQKEAVSKLKNIKVGALFMDTGTGKTRASLELAARRLEDDKVDCILYLCPVSVKRTIVDEIKKHTAGLTYELVSPDGIQGNSDIYIAGIESISQSDSISLVLYELAKKKDCFVIVDESSLITNPRAKRTQEIWRLGEINDYKLILNGTPLSNSEEDLFSQWYFLDYRILGYTSYYSFAANHLEFDERYPNRVARAHNTDYLVDKIAPYTYQVQKEECLDLPDRSYSNRYFYMTNRQQMIYEQTQYDILYDIEIDEFESYTIFQLISACQKIISGIDIFDKPMDNPRIQTLLEILEDIPKQKTIIWCRYVDEIQNISKVLREKYGGDSVAEFWGELGEKERNRELNKFKNEARFLVANKMCGAYGINLQFCSYAIYYSNDFSWKTRYQSEDRIYRQGQEDNVHVIDIICNNSIDERIQECLRNKQNLVDAFKSKIDDIKDKNNIERWLNNAKDIQQ